jgi:hypothetical protein
MSIFQERCTKNCFEKQCIGSYVAHYLRKNAKYLPISIDGGSTNLRIIEAIHDDAKAKRPTVSQVLTNHLEGIYLASDLPDDVPLIWYSTGGVLRLSRSVFAEGAERIIREREFWIAVVGINGFEPPSLQTTTEREHSIKRTMISKARDTIIFPIDSSKWGFPAGEHLHTLDEIVSWGKRVVIVTCYPVKEEASESESEFANRIRRFLNTINDLTQQWQFEINISTVIAGENSIEFTETEWPKTDNLTSELRGMYARVVSPDHEWRDGLIIKLDLYRNDN